VHLASPSPVVLPAPTIELAPAFSGVEGVAMVVDGRVTSAGSTPRVRAVFGDGTPAEAVAVGSDGRFRLAHIYVDEGKHPLQVFADGDGGSASAGAEVNVADYAAVVYMPQQATADHGNLSVPVQVIDPSADRVTITVDFGDRSPLQTLVLAGRDFTLSHTYPAAGNYALTVTLSDDDGQGPSTRMTVSSTPPPSS